MPGDWVLEFLPDSAKPDTPLFSLGVRDRRTGVITQVVSPCASIEEFREALTQVKDELDRLAAEAVEMLRLTADQPTGSAPVNPESAWSKMEAAATEEEMFAYFNGLRPAEREEIAEYVFSRVNMFKGRGPVFSEHYNAATHTLE